LEVYFNQQSYQYRGGTMKKLTEEQIDQAVESVMRTAAGPIDLSLARIQLRAAAPFLQIPWEFPTTNEIGDAFAKFRREETLNNSREGFKRALHEFIFTRNAALLPTPVDPRRETVKCVLGKRYSALLTNNPDLISDFLAALDEVKPLS
jgi:hypothetical protein